jgi:hypothetical protein
LSSSSTTEKKIFTFEVGPNLQNAGIDKWILDLSSNEFVINFNVNSGGGQFKSPFSKTGNASQFLKPMVYSIADVIGKPPEDTSIKAIGREVVEIYSTAIVNGLGKLVSPEAAQDEAGNLSSTTITTDKSRGRKKKKKGTDDIALSPSEIEDNKAKEAYRQDVS